MASSSFDFEDKMTTFSLNRSWSIEKINFYRYKPRDNEPLKSPVFYAPEHDLQFTILIYPNGSGQPYDLRKVYLDASVQVKTISGESGEDQTSKNCYWKGGAQIGIDYTIEIWLNNGNQPMTYREEFKQPVNFTGTDFRKSIYDFGGRDFSYISSNSNLKINCNINVSYPTDSFSGICCSPSPVIEMSRSGDHFEKMKALLETGANSDITLVVGVQEFKVHKFPLFTHSAVFAAMFKHKKTKEALKKKVVIEDVPAEVMRSLLHYIYTGTVENKDDLSVELFSAADKYQLDALKEACERQLSLKLTTDSAFTSLLYADLHNATTLKENCIKFVAFHSMVSSTSPAWSQFTAAARPELVNEVVARVIAKLNL